MSNVRANFYEEDGIDWVEISIVGDPNVFVSKVKDEHKERFPRDWEAYVGTAKPEVEGTDLLELKGIGEKRAAEFRRKGVRTVEEVAAVTDGAIGVLGMGGYALRKRAQKMIADRREADIQRVIQ